MDRKTKRKEKIDVIPPLPMKELRPHLAGILEKWRMYLVRDMEMREDSIERIAKISIPKCDIAATTKEFKETTRFFYLNMASELVQIYQMLLTLNVTAEVLLDTTNSLAKGLAKLRSTKKALTEIEARMNERYEPVMKELDAIIRKRRKEQTESRQASKLEKQLEEPGRIYG